MSQEQTASINHLHLKGYKSIRDVSVSLNKGLNIIIGANGSGKTNFLEFLNAACEEDYGRLFNGQTRRFEILIKDKPSVIKLIGERILKSNKKNTAYRIEKEVFDNNLSSKAIYFLDDYKKIIYSEVDDKDNLIDANVFSTIFLRFENPLNEILKEKLALELAIFNVYDPFLEIVEGFKLFHSQLNNENKFNTFLSHIFYTNEQSANYSKTVIGFTKEVIDNKYFLIDELNKNLKHFSPIKDIKIDWSLTRQSIEVNEHEETATIEGIDFQFFVNSEWINWTKLSDGTKRLFYLIGSVTYAKENEIILMEEPELGVHPHQLTLLMNFLKAQSAEKQIIISTHSPQVLNCLKSDELDRIIVARHEGKAGTKMYHLSDEEKGYAKKYMENDAFLSDYWLQSGFMNEEMTETV